MLTRAKKQKSRKAAKSILRGEKIFNYGKHNTDNDKLDKV